MLTRQQNERKFTQWIELPNGGRRHWLDVAGHRGWQARCRIALAVNTAGLAQAIQFGDRLAIGLGLGEGFQIARIGLRRDLSVAPEVGHAFFELLRFTRSWPVALRVAV